MCKTGGPRCHGEKVKTAASSLDKAKEDFSNHQSNSDVEAEVLERSARRVEEKRIEYAKRIVDHLTAKEIEMHRLQERAKHFWGQETDFATQGEKKIYEEGLETYNRYKDREWDEHTANVPDIDLYKLSGLRDLISSFQKRRFLNKNWRIPESN